MKIHILKPIASKCEELNNYNFINNCFIVDLLVRAFDLDLQNIKLGDVIEFRSNDIIPDLRFLRVWKIEKEIYDARQLGNNKLLDYKLFLHLKPIQ